MVLTLVVSLWRAAASYCRGSCSLGPRCVQAPGGEGSQAPGGFQACTSAVVISVLPRVHQCALLLMKLIIAVGGMFVLGTVSPEVFGIGMRGDSMRRYGY